MTKASSGGDWKGGSQEAPTPVRRVGAVPSLEHTPGAETGRSSFSMINMSPTGSGAPPAFCRICLESKGLPQEPPDAPFPGIGMPCGLGPLPLPLSLSLPLWKGKGGSEEGDRLISPCACTGTQAYVHLTCLRTWQKSVVSSARYAEEGNCTGASVCSVCLHRFSIQPPPVALHIRLQRYAELYARELIWFFLFLCIFYFLLACNLNVVSLFASIFAAMRAAVGLEASRGGLAQHALGPGTVLVASPTKMTSSSIFYRSVVVVYENEAQSGGAIAGVIINKPIKHAELGNAAKSWELPMFLDSQGQGVPKLLGWGGPLARSAMTVMDMCPCCLQDSASNKGPPYAPYNACCACACRASRDLEQSGPGHWARFVFPGLFLGTDTQSLQILEATASAGPSSASSASWTPSKCQEDYSGGTVNSAASVNSKRRNSSRVVLMGHALWQPGQLEAEIRAGWWLVLNDIKNQDSLSMPLKLLWKSLVASHIGVDSLKD